MRLLYMAMMFLVMAGGLVCRAGDDMNTDDVPPTRERVFEYLKNCEIMIITGKDERGEALTRQHFMDYAITVHSWMKEPDALEVATGIDRAWFTKVHDKLDEMWAARRQADLDGLDNSANKDTESKKKFDKAVLAFSVLLLKPEEIHPAKLYSLKKLRDMMRNKAKPVQKKAEPEPADAI